MYQVTIEPMPDNPAKKVIGDKSGLWRVAVYDLGKGSVIQKTLVGYPAENLEYDQAFDLAQNIKDEQYAEKVRAEVEIKKIQIEKEVEHKQKFTDREIMQRAIELAKKYVSEPDKNSPKVAAIVARDGVILGEAYRGELEPGEHAEFTLLERKLAGVTLAGATLFSTLEPCTSRNPPKIPCAQRVIERRIGKVVIGILDRNPDIQGYGYWKLRDAGVPVEHFYSDLAEQIEELNRDFLRPYKMKRSEAETSDPVEPGQVGSNGFKIGYDEDGNKVEWIEEDGEVWPMILRRNDNDILAVYSELSDRVWYVRKLIMFEKMESGEEERKPEHEPFIAAALKKMKEMEDKYGAENLVYDDIEWGIIQGKLSALAWVLGTDWETSLDT